MKKEKLEYHWTSIWSDIFEFWILVWDLLENIKNKIKKIIFKK
jgi:hypothetical protein